MEEDIYRSQFRMPYSLYELLKASADSNRRSVNAELIARLESTFTKKDAVRNKLGLPIAEEDDDVADTPHALIDATSVKGPVSRGLLMDIIASAIEQALGKEEKAIPVDNAKPKPNTGPKPRKPYSKK